MYSKKRSSRRAAFQKGRCRKNRTDSMLVGFMMNHQTRQLYIYIYVYTKLLVLQTWISRAIYTCMLLYKELRSWTHGTAQIYKQNGCFEPVRSGYIIYVGIVLSCCLQRHI
jgi:hypothetical protein